MTQIAAAMLHFTAPRSEAIPEAYHRRMMMRTPHFRFSDDQLSHALWDGVWDSPNVLVIVVDSLGYVSKANDTLMQACPGCRVGNLGLHIDELLKKEPYGLLEEQVNFAEISAQQTSALAEPACFVGRWRRVLINQCPIAADDGTLIGQVLVVVPRLRWGPASDAETASYAKLPPRSISVQNFTAIVDDKLAIEQVYGRAFRDQTVLRHLGELFPTCESNGIINAAKKAWLSRRTIIHEFSVNTGTSQAPESEHYRVNFSPISVVGDERLLCQVVRNSEQQERVKKLEYTEQMFRRLTDAIPEVFWVYDPKLERIVYLSPAYERIWNQPRETLKDAKPDYLAAVHPDDLRALISTLKEQMQGKPTVLEYRVCHGDGSFRWIRDRAFPLLDGTGTVVLITGLAADITEDKEHSDALQVYNTKLSFAIEYGADGYWEHDFATDEIQVSKSWLNLMGLDASFQTFSQEYFWSTVHPDDRSLAKSLYQRHAARETELYEARFRIRDARGRYIWTRQRGRIIDRDRDGQARRCVGLTTDLTETMTSERKMQSMQRDLAQTALQSVRNAMLAAIAHEVNQPLFAIKNFTQVGVKALQQLDLTQAPFNAGRLLKRSLEMISDQVERGSRIVAELRSLANDNQKLVSIIDLHQVVERAVRAVAVFPEMDAVSIKLHLNASVVKVMGEGLQLELVIINLIRNAAQAINDMETSQSEILVTTEDRDSKLRLSVADCGPGLPNGVPAGQLFEPYFSKRKGGLGLGLPICKQIIESHRGVIGARNRPHQGAEFYFELPLESESNERSSNG